jgi:hypothetical protein
MDGMQLTAQQDFAAGPDEVAAMLIDHAFLEKVCIASEAVKHSVSGEGPHTTVSRTLKAPSAASKFTGETITIVEDLRWSPAGPDGSRTASLNLTVPGLPVEMIGTVRLAAGGRGTRVDYSGDLSVNIPFVGKKLEQSAAPAVLDGITLQQRIGDDWLTHRA